MEPIVFIPIVERRYKFHEWLNNYTEAQRRRFLMEIRAELGDVARVTLEKWIDMPVRSNLDVPFGAVLIICRKLGRSPLKALNAQPAPKVSTQKRRRAEAVSYASA